MGYQYGFKTPWTDWWVGSKRVELNPPCITWSDHTLTQCVKWDGPTFEYVTERTTKVEYLKDLVKKMSYKLSKWFTSFNSDEHDTDEYKVTNLRMQLKLLTHDCLRKTIAWTGPCSQIYPTLDDERWCYINTNLLANKIKNNTQQYKGYKSIPERYQQKPQLETQKLKNWQPYFDDGTFKSIESKLTGVQFLSTQNVYPQQVLMKTADKFYVYEEQETCTWEHGFEGTSCQICGDGKGVNDQGH